jgi:voltage-gated potassium channel Kch
VILPRVADKGVERAQDEIAHADSPVVFAGYGRFGQMVGRILRANRIQCTVLDLDPEMVDILGRLGVKAYYGDASRVDLLHAAGCARARLFILAVDDPEVSLKIAEEVHKHFPHLRVLVRARDRPHYFQLKRVGVARAYRETFGSAYEMGVEALRELGYRHHQAHRLARRWRQHEEREIDELAALWGSDLDTYFASARRAMEEAERLMRDEDPQVFQERDAAWDNESLRADRQPDSAVQDPERD